MDDVAKIAARLSEAQRMIVEASEPGGFDDPDQACGCDIKGAGQHAAAKALERKGVGEVEHYDNINTLYWNNALGLAVRTYLMETNNG